VRDVDAVLAVGRAQDTRDDRRDRACGDRSQGGHLEVDVRGLVRGVELDDGAAAVRPSSPWR
jgi:hypothetical protein